MFNIFCERVKAVSRIEINKETGIITDREKKGEKAKAEREITVRSRKENEQTEMMSDSIKIYLVLAVSLDIARDLFKDYIKIKF